MQRFAKKLCWLLLITFVFGMFAGFCSLSFGEEVRWLSEPVTIHPDELRDDTRFIVERDFGDKFAVTLEGIWKPRENPHSEDRRDWQKHAITIECGYLSKGLLVYRVDNADIGPIWVEESRGEALEICQVRQSEFASIRCHRCQSQTSIVLFSAVEDSYSTNMVSFSGQFNVITCDAPTTVLFANCKDSVNRLRLITFHQLNCHPTWGPAQEQFPKLKEFKPRKNRVHVDFANAQDITVLSYNMRLDPNDGAESKAFKASPDEQLPNRTIVRGARNIVLVNGQVLRQRGEDPQKFISRPVRTLVP